MPTYKIATDLNSLGLAMSSGNATQSLSDAQSQQILFAAVVVPLARMIYAGRINPATVTKEEYCSALVGLGRSNDEAFELMVTRVEKEMQLIKHCIEQGEAKSGVVLLFTLIESEVNGLIRSLLRIRGVTPQAITDALKGTDFVTKLDVLLPLLDVTVPDRLRNAALQCRSVRNLVAHNKASPALLTDAGEKPSDANVARDRAVCFFEKNPPDRLRKDIESFSEFGLSGDTSVTWARHLFERFQFKSEA